MFAKLTASMMEISLTNDSQEGGLPPLLRRTTAEPTPAAAPDARPQPPC
jgi:hypothetical protein